MYRFRSMRPANRRNRLLSAFAIPAMLAALLLLTQIAAGSTLERHHLDNGLNVLLYPADRTDRVALVVLYAIGEDHDPVGKCGLAHLTEHIYLTAAAGPTPARTAEQVMRRYPNSWNAQTGADYTVFAVVFAANDLEAELRDAAARMSDLQATQGDLNREKQRVVQEVNNMFHGVPPLAAMNHARERTRPSGNGHRKGGLPEHVEAITLEEIRAWWSRFYKPDNATLVLAGAFDSRRTFGLIAEHFGPIPAGDRPPPARTTGARRLGTIDTVAITSASPNARGHVCLAFAAPEPGSDHYAACLVLVNRMWMQSARSGGKPQVMFSLLDDPTTIFVSAPFNAAQPATEVIDDLNRFVEQATRGSLQPSDTVGTKNNLGAMLGVVDFPDMMLQQNLYGVAFSLARREQLKVDGAELRATLDGLTTQDLREAAREIFIADKRAGVIIVPESP